MQERIKIGIMPHKIRYFLPSIADVFFFLSFVTLSLLAPTKLLLDCDTGYHIRIGEFILNTFSIPRYDIFSFIDPPPRWIAFEWLSEVIMALVYKWGELTAVVIFFAFCISLTYYFLFKILQKDKFNIVIVAFITLLVIAASSIHWLARPHILSMLMLLAWYHILDLYQYKDKNYLYALPILMLLWANLHGAFMIGLVLLGIYIAGNVAKFFFSPSPERDVHKSKIKALLLTLILSLIFSLINPNGYHTILLPYELLSSKFIINHIGEFQSPNFHELDLLPFEILVLFTILILSVSRKKLNAIEILLTLFFINIAFYSVRNIPLFAIVMAPILAKQSQQLLNEHHNKFTKFLIIRDMNISGIDSSAKGCLWIILPVIAVWAFLLFGFIEYHFDEKIKPVAAVEFLKKEQIQGHMYNEYEFGDYVIYSASPQYRVFIDGRADMYGIERLKEYYRINKLNPDWEELLNKYQINFIFFNTDTLFSKYLAERKDWSLIYSDKVASIFVRNDAANARIIRKYKHTKLFVPPNDEDNEM